jgi:hypothetical protein
VATFGFQSWAFAHFFRAFCQKRNTWPIEVVFQKVHFGQKKWVFARFYF